MKERSKGVPSTTRRGGLKSGSVPCKTKPTSFIDSLCSDIACYIDQTATEIKKMQKPDKKG